MTKRDYEMEWMRLGYREGMGSAKFLPPPDSNFVRAYHLTSAEHGISSIRLRRLKVARFSEVNDPFELMALNFHKRETRQLVRRFKDLHNSNTGLLCGSFTPLHLSVFVSVRSVRLSKWPPTQRRTIISASWIFTVSSMTAIRNWDAPLIILVVRLPSSNLPRLKGTTCLLTMNSPGSAWRHAMPLRHYLR